MSVSVEAINAWTDHFGIDRSTGEPITETTVDPETAELLAQICAVAKEDGASADIERSLHQLKQRHFDGGITTEHLEILKAAFTSAAAVIAFLRTAMPLLAKWFGKGRSLTIKSGGIDITIKSEADIDRAIRLLQAAKKK